MSFAHLFHNLCRNYRKPGGIKQLAEDMGRPDDYNTIKNKLNPNTATHHMYVEELDDYVAALDTDEVAKYFCRERGGVFVKTPDFEGIPDAALLDLILERSERLGNLDKQIRTALTDGKISKKSFDEIMRLHDEVTEVREGVKQRLVAMYKRSSGELA